MSVDQLQLGRIDVYQSGTTRRHTLCCLPTSKGKRNKVVCGDDTGTVTCIQYKKGETNLVFKNPPGKRQVTALALGGPKDSRDRIYAAFGQTIQGINKKKGQQFFLYNTILNEDISTLVIEDFTITTACEYSVNVFEASKSGEQVSDLHFYQAPDKIHDLLLMRVSGSSAFTAMLACQDRHVRIIQDSDCVKQHRVGGAVMTLNEYDSPIKSDRLKSPEGEPLIGKNGFKFNQNQHKMYLYGTDNGELGQLFVEGSSHINNGWIIGNQAKKAGINTIMNADMALSGMNDVIVGRDDGTVEVYTYDLYAQDEQQEHEPIFTRDFNESITCMEKGNVVSATNMDVLLSTYSGKLLALTHDVKSNIAHIVPKSSASVSSSSSSSKSGVPDSKEEMERSIKELKMELEKLNEKVAKEKEKYQKLSSEMIAVEQQFNIKSSFKLIPDEACYLLSVEIEMPLDVITLQSNIPIMLLDGSHEGALLSRSARDEKNGNELLATFRCQDATNRLELKIRTVEGQHGLLNVYVVPKFTPKTCQKAEFKIKPLSLHEKVHVDAIQKEINTRPLNSLVLTGNFTLSEIHSWLNLCLPDLPQRLASQENAQQKLYFRSTFLKTILICEYERNRTSFQSDSITAISILKEIISKEATNAKISISLSLDVKDESVSSFLHLLKPELDQHFTLNHKASLIPPLKEIATHETDTSFLMEEYQDIIKNAETIEKSLSSAPLHLDFLRGIVTDLFVDKHKLAGKSAQARVPQLLQTLEHYQFDKLMQIFRE